MFKPEQKEFKEREIIKEGTYIARLYSFVDIGSRDKEVTNDSGNKETVSKHQVRLTFELPKNTRVFDGVEKPLVIGKDYTFSMHEKASLRSVVHALLGVTLTDPEAYNFDFEESKGDILGKSCMISVAHFVTPDGKRVAYIKNVIPLMEGVECPPQFNESVFYMLSMGGNEVFEALPEFVKKKIGESIESTVGPSVKVARDAHNRKIEDINPEDIPF